MCVTLGIDANSTIQQDQSINHHLLSEMPSHVFSLFVVEPPEGVYTGRHVHVPTKKRRDKVDETSVSVSPAPVAPHPSLVFAAAGAWGRWGRAVHVAQSGSDRCRARPRVWNAPSCLHGLLGWRAGLVVGWNIHVPSIGLAGSRRPLASIAGSRRRARI